MNNGNLQNEAFRFGLSTCGVEQLTEEHFRNYAKAGVKELELSFPLRLCDGLNLPEIKRYADGYGVHLWTYHLPFDNPIDISAADKAKREHSIEYLTGQIGKAADIGIELMVIHPSREPHEEHEREEALKRAEHSLAELARVAEVCGVTLAVEDLPRTCLGRNSQEMKRLVAVDEKLRVCFDTNHLLSQPIKEFIMDVGDKIVTTHFSDYDFINERHWVPGEGKINWVELIEALETVGYKGPVLYEVPSAPPATIERRMLTCEDFKENHYQLKHKLSLAAIGKPLV